MWYSINILRLATQVVISCTCAFENKMAHLVFLQADNIRHTQSSVKLFTCDKA